MTPPDAIHGWHARLDSILVAFFVCALVAPWIDEIVRTDKQRGPEEHEQRTAAERPVFDASTLQSYPEKYAAYFDDTFGLRDWLLRWHSIEKYFVFDVSPTSRAVLGRDDWMFYTGDFSMEVFRGLLPMTQKELHNWQVMLEAKRDLLRKKGSQYLFVIGPNKETIYPDYMPARFNRVQPLTRLDQFAEYMKQHSDVEILDLRPALRAARSEDGPGDYVYFQLGTHWNGRGSYLAYRELIDRVGKLVPGVKAKERSELERVEVGGWGDSWATNMYIADLVPQREVQFVPKERRAATVLDSGWGMGRKHWLEVDDPSLPRAVMFHDSFGAYIDELMAEHFSRLACFWQYSFDSRAVADEHPDIVIELFVERALYNLNGADLEPRETDLNEASFAHSNEIVYQLDLARDASSFKALGETELHAEQDDAGRSLAIETKTPADTFLLPEFTFPPAKHLLARLDITSPMRSMLSVFYKREQDQDYSRRNSCLVPLIKGRNQVYFEIDEPRLQGQLRIRPGDHPGRYTLQALEVRALPPK
jgi:hypothetical protein